MVGAVRFELTTSCTRNKRATRLRYAPTQGQQKVPGVEAKCNFEFQYSSNFTLCSFPRECFSQAVLGTILNVAAIVAGGIAGLMIKKQPSAATQSFFKNALGILTVYFGLRLTWLSINGSFGQALKQLGIVLLSLSLGNLTGKLLHLQKASNRIGQLTRDRMASASPENPQRFSDGFTVCSLLFCAAPLGILGAIHEGLLPDYFYPLAIKALMDGLATMSFAAMFGWGVVLSAVPVLVFQGTITLACAHSLAPFLQAHGLTDSVNATGGLLIFCVALLIFEIRKVPVTDYLPSLLFAPLLTWLLR
jgi:uncharacterized membrane protein YqgA involved in biofilm formation